MEKLSPEMNTEYLPYKSTGSFSKLVNSYLDNESILSEFYHYPFTWESFGQVIADRQQFPQEIRAILSRELVEQYGDMDISGPVRQNIRLLQDNNVFCIVTAHQLNILTGPLYVLIKISNTISICRELEKRFPGNRFVPVYMLGSEDHDFNEIATTRVFQHTLSWEDRQSGPMGRYQTESVLPLIEELRLILGNLPFAGEWLSLLEEGYRYNNLADATRYILHGLFGRYGLVCVNGDSPVLKRLFVPVMQKELVENFSYPLVRATSEKLEERGFHVQLSGREINLFYVAGNIRERLVKHADETFGVLHTELTFSLQELLRELSVHPEHFSPNAVLRPLYQQAILPALAYVGGGGELAYWLQLKAIFEQAGINYPMLVLRTSITIMSSTQVQKISKLGLQPRDIFLDTELLKKQFLFEQEDLEPFFFGIREELDQLVKRIQKQAEEADLTLRSWAGAEGQKMKDIEAVIERRIMKAYKSKHEQSLQQIEKIKEQLFPEGELQERILNGGQWYAKYGQKFIETLIQQNPFNKQFTLLIED